jgi:ribosomal protein S24E
LQILEKKESKLLGRTEVDVLFPSKAGSLSRRDAVKEVAQSMKVEENRVSLIKLASGSGSQDLLGTFRVYDTEASRKAVSPGYLAERLMTKDERKAAKEARKKAQQAAAQAKQQATAGKKK